MKSSILLSIVASVSIISAQKNASTSKSCPEGFYPGTDTVIYTTPYTYAQVMSIIGDYQNLTWSGSPEGSVSLDGPTNTVGTTRTYDIAGAHVIEKIAAYSKAAKGPYEEIHTLGLLTIPAANVSFSADYDGTTVTPTCDGKASILNFTASFCATNASAAESVLHMLHLTDAETVGKFLGGKNFTTCKAISGSCSNANTTAPPAVVSGNGATGLVTSVTSVLVAVGLLALIGF
ncbi:uncharacterized protein RAG0_09042 [Rhynchosporium agropyri]|uniref:Uncharacterized protein n=1 Tax=Rhynchosporium agropyri TaxID=914238 RepID=A0A1E1KTK2_9HELO|nr:uncharacterized protein RAG0_09042 [Rhynchosporium agropyri]